jgi:hypothetical protein
MKRDLASLPSWYLWSDGRAFTRDEAKKFRAICKKTRLPHEPMQTWFYRARAVVEKYNATVAKSKITHRGMVGRGAYDWMKQQEEAEKENATTP